MGFIEETGVAQHYRDIRIAPIYEGTNGIQAMDLVGRKLGLRGGAAFGEFVAGIVATADEAVATGDDDLAVIGEALRAGAGTLRDAATWIRDNAPADPNNTLAAATPFLELAGIVTGAWVLTRAALAAAALRAGDGGGFADDFLAQRVVTARFFATQVLPKVAGLLPAVTAGPRDLFAATF